MKVLSETERRLKNIMMEKRTVLQTRLNDLGASRISAEVTAARSEVEHRLKELEKAFTQNGGRSVWHLRNLHNRDCSGPP